MATSTEDFTRLLADWRSGDSGAFDRLFPLVYDELRGYAGAYMRRERSGHTLQATAVVNELYMRMFRQNGADVGGRSHFLALAARGMQQLLIDHSRSARAQKRGGGGVAFGLDEARDLPVALATDHVALADALKDLERDLEPVVSNVVVMKFYGGMTNDECAEALDVSVATVKRKWAFGKAWLKEYLDTEATEHG